MPRGGVTYGKSCSSSVCVVCEGTPSGLPRIDPRSTRPAGEEDLGGRPAGMAHDARTTTTSSSKYYY